MRTQLSAKESVALALCDGCRTCAPQLENEVLNMPRKTLVDIKAKIKHETERAWLLETEDGKTGWVPKSVVEYDLNDGVFTMPEELAIEKELV